MILQQLSNEVENWHLMTSEQQHLLLSFHLQHVQRQQVPQPGPAPFYHHKPQVAPQVAPSNVNDIKQVRFLTAKRQFTI